MLQVVTHFNQIGIYNLRQKQFEAAIYLLDRFSAPEVQADDGDMKNVNVGGGEVAVPEQGTRTFDWTETEVDGSNVLMVAAYDGFYEFLSCVLGND